MKSLRIVLVEPKNPANVGFIARILANFGVSDWVQVGGVEILGSEAERTGASALETLNLLRRVPSLDVALEGMTHSIAFTSRSGKYRQAELLPELTFPSDEGIALVFGREDRGLETQEVERCSQLCRIPTRDLSSLNLSHAVAVALYELSRAPSRCDSEQTSQSVLSNYESRVRVLERVAEEIEEIEFPDRGEETKNCLRRLEAVNIEARDLRVIEKILKHARWRRESRVSK